MAHVNLHQPYEPGHEKHECEDDQSEQCVAGYLADDIAIQNTHDANAQCITLSARLRFSPRNRRAIYRVVANFCHLLSYRLFLLVYFESIYAHC